MLIAIYNVQLLNNAHNFVRIGCVDQIKVQWQNLNKSVHMSIDESHLKVLRTLQLNPEVNQRGLALELGVSLGKINYCLKALLERGLIKVQNFRGSGNKLAYAYLLTSAGMSEKAELTALFLKRKVAEYEALNHEIEQLRLELKAAETPKTAAQNLFSHG